MDQTSNTAKERLSPGLPSVASPTRVDNECNKLVLPTLPTCAVSTGDKLRLLERSSKRLLLKDLTANGCCVVYTQDVHQPFGMVDYTYT
mmetsp:Transcript_34780/g.63984  ORF Transcript_34780/g.63984 Transcript_34780/m.63984 type:complete len:89 (-) Transcript_34780:254-520(-)